MSIKQKQINNLSIDTISNANSKGSAGDIAYILETGKLYKYVIDNSLSNDDINIISASGSDAYWVSVETSASGGSTYYGTVSSSMTLMTSSWGVGEYAWHSAMNGNNGAYVFRGNSTSDIRIMIDNTLIINNLTSTSTTQPLSANQGKVLKDMIDALPSGGGSSAYFEDTFVCGENITAGQICYFNTSTGKLNLAIDNGTAKDNLLYVAKESGALNDSIKVASTGNIDFLSGLTAGQSYALSKTTAGAFAPFSSFTAGDYVVRIFTALTSTKVKFYDEPVIMQV